MKKKDTTTSGSVSICNGQVLLRFDTVITPNKALYLRPDQALSLAESLLKATIELTGKTNKRKRK